MSDKKLLVLFTNAFPYGEGEQFLETEIGFLAKCFPEIHIHTLSSRPPIRAIPENVRLVPYESRRPISLISCFFRHLVPIIRIFARELVSATYRKKYLSHFKYSLKRLLARLNAASDLAPLIVKYNKSETVFYSYWFGPWSDILCLVKSIYCPDLEFITRAHSYDCDIDVTKNGFIPFRRFTMPLAVCRT